MIRLPHETSISRGPLRAFALTAGSASGALAGVAVGGGVRRRLAAAGTAAAMVAAPAIVRPQLSSAAYLAWDRTARRVAERASTHVAWVLQRTALPPSDPPLPSSGWQPVLTGPHAMVGSRPAGDARGELDRHLRTQRRPRRRWLAVCLAALRWLRPDAEPPDHRALPSDTYTLF